MPGIYIGGFTGVNDDLYPDNDPATETPKYTKTKARLVADTSKKYALGPMYQWKRALKATAKYGVMD